MAKEKEDQKYDGYASFTAVQYVIDDVNIKSGDIIITGHFVLMKGSKAAYTLPKNNLRKGNAALLEGIKLLTKFKLNMKFIRE